MKRNFGMVFCVGVFAAFLMACSEQKEEQLSSQTMEFQDIQMETELQEADTYAEAENIETEQTQQEQTENKSTIIDLKDYSDYLPEDLGGNLGATLLSLLHPDQTELTYDSEMMAYVVEQDKLWVGASTNNDGYIVWQYAPVDGFLIYGIQPGMTEEEAVSILGQQGILLADFGGYVIDDEKYIQLDVVDGTVTQVIFEVFLGSNMDWDEIESGFEYDIDATSEEDYEFDFEGYIIKKDTGEFYFRASQEYDILGFGAGSETQIYYGVEDFLIASTQIIPSVEQYLNCHVKIYGYIDASEGCVWFYPVDIEVAE